MFLNIKAIKTYVKEHDKQISTNAIDALNIKVENILLGAIRNVGHFKRVSDTEINFTKS
jgi:hypothetical protein